MALIWERSGEAYYAMVIRPDGEVVFRLVVEELPEGMWDWTVWEPGRAPSLAVRGVARTAQEAMRGAASETQRP